MRLQVQGMSELKQKIDKLKNGLQKRQQIIHDVGKVIENDIEKNIESQGGRLGVSWKSLSPVTQRLREKHGFPPSQPILIETGDMKAGIKLTVSNNDKAIIEPTGVGGIPSQSNIVKARRHQFGERERNVPARRFFEVSKTGMKDIIKILKDYINRLLK